MWNTIAHKETHGEDGYGARLHSSPGRNAVVAGAETGWQTGVYLINLDDNIMKLYYTKYQTIEQFMR